MSAEEDESHALLVASKQPTAEDAAVEDTVDAWEASESVCSRTLLALRSLVLNADAASQGTAGESTQQELTRSAAHALLRLTAAR